MRLWRAKKDAFDASRLVWLFGAPRTGSTWLSEMFSEAGFEVWKEPLVGELFGHLYYRRSSETQRTRSKHFILGAHRDTWLSSVRSLVLEGVAARFSGDAFVLAKEPNGSIGAPLLSEALPDSRLICLVRDPRDVVASALASGRDGGWREKARNRRGAAPETDLSAEKWAGIVTQQMGNAVVAYHSHAGPKSLVRYEDLRTDPLAQMSRLHAELGITAQEVAIERAVEKCSWEAIPEENKGPDKFYRKATPGSWREDLTSEEAQVVESATAPLLREFYS